MFKINNKFKRISLDMVINLAGSGIAMLALHLGIYPNVARVISGDLYGEMQAIMSTVFLVSGTLGGTLSTVRLVRDYDYNERNIVGDFNIMLFACGVINALLLPLIMVLYFQQDGVADILLVICVSTLNMTADYFSVGLRLKLNYKKIFISQVCGCVGFFIGFLLFKITLIWQMIFIVAYLIKTFYCIFNTDLIRESVCKTKLLKESISAFLNLGFAGLLSRALSYFDKLLIFPLLGGTAVSIYYVANIFGKLIIQVLEPITNVILSYLSKQKNVSSETWKKVIPAGILFCGIMYIIGIVVSKPIILLLYPQWADEAIILVPITTLSLSVSAYVNILYPFTLKTIEPIKQLYINGCGLGTYIAITLCTFKQYGLIGCAVALLVSYLVKLVLMLVMSWRKISRNEG